MLRQPIDRCHWHHFPGGIMFGAVGLAWRLWKSIEFGLFSIRRGEVSRHRKLKTKANCGPYLKPCSLIDHHDSLGQDMRSRAQRYQRRLDARLSPSASSTQFNILRLANEG
jgi:hypothetical protein